jgi:hypothetical protein
MLIAFVVVGLLVVVVLDTGPFASLAVQECAHVKTTDGTRYRIRLTPVGVDWIAWNNWDMSWLWATPKWITRLRRHNHDWIVTVRRSGDRYDAPPIVSEMFQSRRAAQQWLSEMTVLMESGRMSADDIS